jgi:hypothetical protein
VSSSSAPASIQDRDLAALDRRDEQVDGVTFSSLGAEIEKGVLCRGARRISD